MDANDIELLRSLEQSLQRSDIRRSQKALDALIADGFIEFGSSGKTYDRAATIAALTAEPAAPDSAGPEIADFACRRLAVDTVLVTYRNFRTGRNADVMRSSIWTRATGSWQILFHQATPVLRDITQGELLAGLVALRPEFEEDGVVHLHLFGSRARRDNRADSDVDLLVAVAPGRKFSLLDAAGIYAKVMDHLGLQSSILVEDDAPSDLLERVLQNAIQVF